MTDAFTEQLVDQLRAHASLSHANLHALLRQLGHRTSQRPAALETLVNCGGLETLLVLLRQPLNGALLADAVAIVAACCGRSAGRRYFSSQGGLHVVINVVDVVADRRVVSCGLRALANLAKNASLCRSLHQQDVLQLSLDKLRLWRAGDKNDVVTTNENVLLVADTGAADNLANAQCDRLDGVSDADEDACISIVRLWRIMGQTRWQVRQMLRTKCISEAAKCLQSGNNVLLRETAKMIDHFAQQNAKQTAEQLQEVDFALSRLMQLCGVTSLDDVVLCSPDAQCHAPARSGAARKRPRDHDEPAQIDHGPSESPLVSSERIRGGAEFDGDVAVVSLRLVVTLARLVSPVRPLLASRGCLQLLFTAAQLQPLSPAADSAAVSLSAGDSQRSAALASFQIHPDVRQLVNDCKFVDRCQLISCLCLFAVESVNRARLRALGYVPVLVRLLASRPTDVHIPAVRWRWLQRRVLHALFQFVYDRPGFDQMRSAGLLPLLVQRLDGWTLQSRTAGGDNYAGQTSTSESCDSDKDTERRQHGSGCAVSYRAESPTYLQQKRQHQQMIGVEAIGRRLSCSVSSPPLSTGSLSPDARSPTSSCQWSDDSACRYSPERQLTSVGSPYVKLTYGDPPDAGLTWADEHDWLLQLLSVESQRERPDAFMGSDRCIVILLGYLTHAANASQRAANVISRLARNAHFFRQLVCIRLASQLTNLAMQNEKADWRAILRNFSSVACDSFGRAILEDLLCTSAVGEPTTDEAKAAALTVANIIREPVTSSRLMLHCRGLEAVMSVLETEDIASVATNTTDQHVTSTPACDALLTLLRNLSSPPLPSLDTSTAPAEHTTICRSADDATTCDVTLVLDDGRVSASRRLLAAGSDVLAALLTGGFSEASSATVRVRQLPVAVARAMLHVVYGCQLSEESQSLGNRSEGGESSCPLQSLSAKLWLPLMLACDRFLLLPAAEQLQQLVLRCSCPRQLRRLYTVSRREQMQLVGWRAAASLSDFLLWRMVTVDTAASGRRQLRRLLRRRPDLVVQDLQALCRRILTEQQTDWLLQS